MTEQLKTVLIVTEGMTECKYLRHLKRRNAGYLVQAVESPRKSAREVFQFCCKEIKNRDLDPKGFDMVYCVVDLDYNSQKDLEFVTRSAKSKGIRVVISNPCYEYFYISHFRGGTLTFSTPKEAVEHLKEYIPDYDKSKDYWEELKDGRDDAIKRCNCPLSEVKLQLGTPCSSNIGGIFLDMLALDRGEEPGEWQ